MLHFCSDSFFASAIAAKNEIQHFQVEIRGSNVKLIDVWMIDGKIDAEIPQEIAILPNWKVPITVAVHKGSSHESKQGKIEIIGKPKRQ